jgi:hypothetical protein
LVAKTYRPNAALRLINKLTTSLLVRLGIGPANAYAALVRGQRSGTSYRTPVRVLAHDGGRYLVAVFGETPTVRNLRAAGRTTLIRGRSSEQVRLTEVPVADRVPMIRGYIEMSPRLASSVGVTASSPDAAVAAVAPDHTVFRIEPA